MQMAFLPRSVPVAIWLVTDPRTTLIANEGPGAVNAPTAVGVDLVKGAPGDAARST